jgi:hypothetical protein
MGAVFLVVDDSDAPDDNDPCTLHYCTLGTPVTAPKCGPTQQCFGGNCFP